MYKLIILFETPADLAAFQPGWQEFLGLAEQMPGLRGEVVSPVDRTLFGPQGLRYYKIHELLFDTRQAMEAALQSEQGQAAGECLQRFTAGRVVLLAAAHMQAQPKEFKKKKD